MLPINRSLAIFLILAGVTLLAISHEADSASVSPSPANQVSAPVNDEPEETPADTDDEDSDLGDDDDDDEEEEEEEEDYYYEDDGDGSPEEGLAWLAQTHLMIRTDCEAMNETLASNSTDTDPDLKEHYQQCQEALASVKADMRMVISEILDDSDSDNDQAEGSQ